MEQRAKHQFGIFESIFYYRTEKFDELKILRNFKPLIHKEAKLRYMKNILKLIAIMSCTEQDCKYQLRTLHTIWILTVR